jgi:hypothetical protein
LQGRKEVPEEKKEEQKPVKTIEELTKEMEEHKAKLAELEKKIPAPVPPTVPARTSPAKEQKSSEDALAKSAAKAKETGTRQDVAEYMRKRRSII